MQMPGTAEGRLLSKQDPWEDTIQTGIGSPSTSFTARVVAGKTREVLSRALAQRRSSDEKGLSMRILRIASILIILLAAAALPALSQRNFDDVTIEIVPVAGNVSMLVGSG